MFFILFSFCYYFADKPKNLECRFKNEKMAEEGGKSLSLAEVIFPTDIHAKVFVQIRTDKRVMQFSEISP